MKLGVLPNKSVHLCKKETKICNRIVNTKTKFTLTISGQQTEKILNIFNINSKYFNSVNRYNRFFENDRYWFIPITEIIEEYYEGPVYNLEVEDDNSYLVNGGLSAHNCVFSGKRGLYTEADVHDATDAYGKSKSAGEPPNATIIRTSIIGEELKGKLSFIEWVKSNKDKTVNGFHNWIWNGITCLEWAKICDELIKTQQFWLGAKNVCTEPPIPKDELVKLVSEVFNLNVTVNSMDAPEKNDKSLKSIIQQVKIIVPDYKTQLIDLYDYQGMLRMDI
jgi:hypothetical protein